MKNGYKWLKIVWRGLSLTVLTVLLCFWIIKLVYCGHGYVTNGMIGFQNAIIHGGLVPHDPAQWGHPRWDIIALQYSGIADYCSAMMSHSEIGRGNARTSAPFL